MLAATLLSVLPAAIAAVNPTLLTRAAFPVDAIPSVCDKPCETYKSVFGADASADARSTACQGSVFEQFNICMNCTTIEGMKNGMTSEQVQLLSLAVQQMGQECIETSYTSQYAGEIPAPTSLPMSSFSSSAVPSSAATANSSASATSANPFASSSAQASASGASSAGAASPSESKHSGAATVGASISAAFLAAGAVALLV